MKLDARSKLLSLTAKGRRTLEALHAFGRQQVRGALAALDRGRAAHGARGHDALCPGAAAEPHGG